LLSILFSDLLTGCGFELRGAAALPPELGKIYVQSSAALRNDIEVFLQGSSTKLVNTRPQANLTITLSNHR